MKGKPNVIFIKLTVLLAIFFIFYFYKELYAQVIRFNQLIIRDELVVLGNLKVNKLIGLKQDTVITEHIRATEILINPGGAIRTPHAVVSVLEMVDVIGAHGNPVNFNGAWLFDGEWVEFRSDSNRFFSTTRHFGPFILPSGRKWGNDSVLIGSVKLRRPFPTGLTFIDTLGTDTLFIWMNNTWVKISP